MERILEIEKEIKEKTEKNERTAEKFWRVPDIEGLKIERGMLLLDWVRKKMEFEYEKEKATREELESIQRLIDRI